MAEEENDYFAPPAEPIEVFCLHCGNVYSSSEIRFLPRADGPSICRGQSGDWVCPAPGCSGVGYHFDIHSVEEWENEPEEEAFIDDEEFEIDEETDEFAFEAQERIDANLNDEDFLPPQPVDPEDAFREIQRDLSWFDTHEHPYVRIWRMPLEFHPERYDFHHDESQQSRYPFNEDDIPF